MHARRKLVVRVGSPPNSEINITPLVDVVLVLLIIFMVVTPLLEKDIEVRVPDQEEVEQPDDVPPDQLVVSVDEKGTIAINREEVPEGDYVKKLERVLAAKKKGDRLVFFVAEDKANYGKVVQALDGARLAGAEVLGMATEKLPGAGDAPAPEAPPAP